VDTENAARSVLKGYARTFSNTQCDI